jgi:alpha-mannosidase
VARLSLVRGPTFPDPRGDKGVHRFRYGFVPGATIGDAVREGYRFNLPPRAASGRATVAPLVSLSNPAVVVEAVKAADDRSGDVVVRCYESLGGRAATTVGVSFPLAKASITDLLERPTEQLGIQGADEIRLSLRPFQVVTLRLSRK